MQMMLFFWFLISTTFFNMSNAYIASDGDAANAYYATGEDRANVYYATGDHPSSKELPKKVIVIEKPKKKVVQAVVVKYIDLRLPRCIRPLHYHIKLIPYINSNFTIDGYCELTFRVLERTKIITLHMSGIIIKKETCRVTDQCGNHKIQIIKQIFDSYRQFYIVHLAEELNVGEIYKISVNYIGYLGDDYIGFFRSSYYDDLGTLRWLAATRFKPTYARKAFPCLDEPALKAKFTIEIAREKFMSSISNMFLSRTVPRIGHPNWVWDIFQKSVYMSTYQIAFVVSDFQCIKLSDHYRDNHNHYDFRVWVRKTVVLQVDYSFKIGPPAFKFFEDYFNFPFPLAKQDMIALPDFALDAIGNYGLISYRETSLLCDPKISRAVDQFHITTIIVRELAHQWFGNLVTCLWWTDVWINEGFAIYLQYLGVNHVQPSFKILEQFVIIDLHNVFHLDCLESSHAISIEVKHHDEINGIFDGISYSKGACMIRMLHLFLGEHTFRIGLSNYLREFAYRSAVQDDIWRYLTEQAHRDGSLAIDLNIKVIMDTWTLQTGFPVITVKNKMDGTAIITQERFLLARHSYIKPSSPNNYKWWIPISFCTKSKPDFTITIPKLWMKPTEAFLIISDIPSNKDWYIFNIQQAGYFRVNYDENNWEAIINQLLSNHLVIESINRAQIIDDAMVLARAGLLSYATAFKVLSYLKNEDDFVPWQAALNNLHFIQNMFAYSGGYGALKEFFLSLIIPIYVKVGFIDIVTDPHLDQRKREIILSMACSLDYHDCVHTSVTLYRKWMQYPDDITIILPNLKSVVYCTAIRQCGYDEWKFAWDRYKISTYAAEKRILLKALGCTKESWVLGGYLTKSIKVDQGIRRQDISTVIGSVGCTFSGKLIAWHFVKEKWTYIFLLFGHVSFTLDIILKSVTVNLNTAIHLKELRAFQKEHTGHFGSVLRAVTQVIENTENNVVWMEKHYQLIVNWLSSNGYENSIYSI